ncbi:MAG: hypothetical protein WA139_02850 [Candidatus Aenigmatarchaeota archaeon]
MEDKQLKEITERLDKLIRLVAVSDTVGRTTLERIIILSKCGFRPAEIAEIVGTTSNVVNVRLSEMRKNKKGDKNG